MKSIFVQDSVPADTKQDMTSFNRTVSWIAAGVYIVLVAIGVVCGRFYQTWIVGSPRLIWEYDEILADNLPPRYEWVRDTALACRVDDEGAYVYIADILGEQDSEVILDYQIDGIVLPNHQFLDIYSTDGSQVYLKSVDLVGVGYGFTRINGVIPIYGYGLFDNFAVSYVYSDEKYVLSAELAIVAWLWRIACIFAWQGSMPVETGIVFILMQIAFCCIVAYNEKKKSKRSNLWFLKAFSIRFLPLFMFESLLAFIVFVLIVGPIIGLIVQTLILRKSLSWLPIK